MMIDHLFQSKSTSVTAIEEDFPIVEVSRIAEKESWRKEIYRPIYHIHKWWATRLGSVFRAITVAALSDSGKSTWDQFYRYQNFKGKIVLDPFMGSGTTIGEAIKLGAKAIGCDINPVSTFITHQSFKRVSVKQLQAAFAAIEKQVASKIQHYYLTVDPQTQLPIQVLYYFWVKVVTTPDGEEIPLFAKYVFSQNAYPKRKPKAQIICPHCWNITEDRYDSTSLECVHCLAIFNPQVGPVSGQYITTKQGNRYRIKDLIKQQSTPPKHKMYAILALRTNGDKVYLPVTKKDIDLYIEAEAELYTKSDILPVNSIRKGYNTNQILGYNYKCWKDLFNSRQLLCLNMLLESILTITNQDVQEQMLCLFLSTLEFNNMFCSFKGEGTGAVRHMFSNHILKPERMPLENSIWGNSKSSGTFSTLFQSRLLKAKQYLDVPFEIKLIYDDKAKKLVSTKVQASNPINVEIVDGWNELQMTSSSVMLLNGDSSNLPLPNAVVDAVITDPPYFDFVHYSELSDFFFAWLSPVLKHRYAWLNKPDSSDPGEVQHKEPQIFSRQLTTVFCESHRVLKDNGVLAFSFHHSRSEGWAAIYEAITAAGFAVVAVYPVHGEVRSSSIKSSTKSPISLDVILVCKKQSVSYIHITKAQIFYLAAADANRLRNAGMTLSQADVFVILAGYTLMFLSKHLVDYEMACLELETVREKLARKNI